MLLPCALRQSQRWDASNEESATVQADRDGEGSPTESCMSMESIPMRKRSRKPKHVYNAADVAAPQASWKSSIYKPVKKVLPPLETELPHSVKGWVLLRCVLLSSLQNPVLQGYLPEWVSVQTLVGYPSDEIRHRRDLEVYMPDFHASMG